MRIAISPLTLLAAHEEQCGPRHRTRSAATQTDDANEHPRTFADKRDGCLWSA
jgi:hypothetical protein